MSLRGRAKVEAVGKTGLFKISSASFSLLDVTVVL